MESTPIYLDVSALCRPFDDQIYLRVRMETEAINLVLSKIQEGRYRLLVSPAHGREIDAIPDPIERIKLQAILEQYGEPIQVNLSAARQRAEELVTLGFGVADAAHIALAEMSKAKFITCDDKLLRKCVRNKIKVWCGSPVLFCLTEDLR